MGTASNDRAERAREPLEAPTQTAAVPIRRAPPPDAARLEASRAAVRSFALERERALERTEHSASVRRLRQAVGIGIVVWSATGLLDAWVTSFVAGSSLRDLLALRVLGLIAGLLTWWQLRKKDEPSPALLTFLDLGIFTWVSVLVSIMCMSLGGITSPYAAGLSTILVARGITIVAPWRRGIWHLGVPAASFPLTMLVAALADERLRAQFQDRTALGLFVTSLIFLVSTWVMLTLGGHFAWRLRREALELRNIGRYELERRVGGGGMGEVWAAFDRTLKQRVALKTVRGYEPGASAVVRLEREVRALAELTHPNTVRVFDHGVTDDGLWYYAMELLHGENLRELVMREGPMDTRRLLRIAGPVLRALGEAHDKGIIHRDIKPDNVFVAELGGERDVPKLLDFGIAQAMVSDEPELTSPGWLVGTPAYMAPEVMAGRPADARSDIYSFGATLYFALSGKLPFPDVSGEALFDAHRNQAVPPLSSGARGPISPELERIIDRCMAKNPAERYSSAQALYDELRSIEA